MKIQQFFHHESGYRYEITIESKDIQTHSAMTDLTEYQRELIKNHLNYVGVIADKVVVARKQHELDRRSSESAS